MSQRIRALRKPKKVWSREADGHTYYFRRGVLMGCPTFADGSFDWHAETPVDDFEERLSPQDEAEIRAHLQK
jgi:hypothetical protein